ncbi:hypothetical protein CleRT_00430 [Candidatus Coxiella mudrowiae]|uniref:Transposase n=1 Tax=Candidatus Coxiella mudrowiae TaxID=2054173 RepID=A0ABN4HR56_9COXI|nr:hypothetical protein CleRT_00430 [Candidatus Coxiella mudrowiae]
MAVCPAYFLPNQENPDDSLEIFTLRFLLSYEPSPELSIECFASWKCREIYIISLTSFRYNLHSSQTIRSMLLENGHGGILSRRGRKPRGDA